VGKIYQYVPPIAGVKQGNYEPIIRLIPPTKIQIATLLGKFNPSQKTNVDFELGISNNDLNLFSPINDGDNQGLAGNSMASSDFLPENGKWTLLPIFNSCKKNSKPSSDCSTLNLTAIGT
jgi:hypothetical protein